MAQYSMERYAYVRVHHVHASLLPCRLQPRPGRSKRSRMEHGKEHGAPDGYCMALGHNLPHRDGTHQHHPRVYRRHAHPLDSEKVQVPLSHHICIAPDSGDGCSNGVHHLRDLPVHERRLLPIHLLPVLAAEPRQWTMNANQRGFGPFLHIIHHTNLSYHLSMKKRQILH